MTYSPLMNTDFRTDRLREDLTTLVDNEDYASPYDATFYRKDEDNRGDDWDRDKTSAVAQFSQNVDDFPALHGELIRGAVSGLQANTD